MTSIDDLIGHEYGNSGNSSDKEEEQQTASDLGNGKGRKKNDTQGQTKYIAYKYSNKGKGILHEATIIARRVQHF